MSTGGYILGCIRVIVGGAIRDLPADTLCVLKTPYIVGASFEVGGVYTYGDNSSSDYGPNEIRGYSPILPMSIIGCMGQDVYVLLPNNDTVTRGVRCRVESAAEAFSRADIAITMLQAKLELAEMKCLLASRGPQ